MKIKYSLTKKAFGCGGLALVSRMNKELKLSEKFSGLKIKGLPLDKIALSILSIWANGVKSVRATVKEILNNPLLLKQLELERIEKMKFKNVLKTYYRALEIVGLNYEEVFSEIIDEVEDVFGMNLKKVFNDYTTSFFYGKKCKLAKHGFSKDRRPDKKQVKIGIALTEDAKPFFISVVEGNKHDCPQFRKDYEKYKDKIPEDALIVHDKGCDSADNRKAIRSNHHHFLTGAKMEGTVKGEVKSLKKKDMTPILKYKGKKYEKTKRVFGLKKKMNGKYFYFYFDERREESDKEKRKEKLKKIMDEKIELEKLRIKKGYKAVAKRLKKQKKIVKQLNEEVITTTVIIQKRLFKKTDKQIKEEIIDNEKEFDGKFVLVSSKDMSLKEALKSYRKKDISEKMISDLKSVMHVKPSRVWNENEVIGCVLLKMLVILFISLMQNECNELINERRETIIERIKKLTVGVRLDKFGRIIEQEWMNLNPLLIKILKIPI